MEKTFSEAFESYVNWIVFFFFLTSVNLAMEASAYLVNDSTAETLRAWAHWPARGGVVVMFIAMGTWFRHLRKKKGGQYCRSYLNEYVTETIKRSSFVAFILTLVFVALLDNVTNNTVLPADFYIKLPGLSLTAGFSLSFFLYNYMNNPDDSEEEWAQ